MVRIPETDRLLAVIGYCQAHTPEKRVDWINIKQTKMVNLEIRNLQDVRVPLFDIAWDFSWKDLSTKFLLFIYLFILRINKNKNKKERQMREDALFLPSKQIKHKLLQPLDSVFSSIQVRISLSIHQIWSLILLIK